MLRSKELFYKLFYSATTAYSLSMVTIITGGAKRHGAHLSLFISNAITCVCLWFCVRVIVCGTPLSPFGTLRPAKDLWKPYTLATINGEGVGTSQHLAH